MPYIHTINQQTHNIKNYEIIKIYSVNITPSGIIPKGYTNEFQNRVFRQFDKNYFIRVNLCENNGDKLYA
jgi:hypothetical protein